MSALNKIAYALNRRDEVPNQSLARELAEQEDSRGIAEIAGGLQNNNKSIASDCIKVLYEIGYLKPELIAGYASVFLKLLSHKQNRMIWGAMIALSTVASLKPAELWAARQLIEHTIETGSVITEVWGIRTLAQLAALKPAYNKTLSPFLLTYLENCRAIDFATRMETLYKMINKSNNREFYRIIEEKKVQLSPAQLKKVERLLAKWRKAE